MHEERKVIIGMQAKKKRSICSSISQELLYDEFPDPGQEELVLQKLESKHKETKISLLYRDRAVRDHSN